MLIASEGDKKHESLKSKNWRVGKIRRWTERVTQPLDD